MFQTIDEYVLPTGGVGEEFSVSLVFIKTSLKYAVDIFELWPCFITLCDSHNLNLLIDAFSRKSAF